MQIFDTKTRQLQTLPPPDTYSTAHPLRMYTCGPTVYNPAHIGNLRSYIAADSLYRTLQTAGYPVHWVMNLTDIDDKTIRNTLAEFGAKATPEHLLTYTERFTQQFFKDLTAVGIDSKAITFIRVSEVMPEILKTIAELVDLGFAYTADDGVYFSIAAYQEKFGDYGVLTGQKFLAGTQIGARVAVDEYDKEQLSDFALWKNHNLETDGQIFWESSRFGNGRPGWHIECSVINAKAFNSHTTDIHTGGIDLIFPHHTNEIAQSTPLYPPFTKFWHHTEHIMVDGKKMAKSAQNFYTLSDLYAWTNHDEHTGLALRFLYLQTQFQKSQNFTKQSFMAAFQGLNNLYNTLTHPTQSEEFPEALEVVLAIILKHAQQNLDFPKSIAQALKSALQLIAQHGETAAMNLKELDALFGLSFRSVYEQRYNQFEIPESIHLLLQQREQARLKKDYTAADSFRNQIENAGFEIIDTESGSEVRKKST